MGSQGEKPVRKPALQAKGPLHKKSDLLIREMRVDDIPAALRLCRLSGWNQMEEDWRIFLRSNPNGSRLAERDGEVVGTVATIRYGDRFSWLSMLLVAPEERGNGVGTRLLQEGLAILKSERCCRLDATPAGRQLYRKHSFLEEYSLSRMTATIDANRFTSAPADTRPMRESDLGEITCQDFEVFGSDRSGLLIDLYQRSPEYARVIEKNGHIAGYLFGRRGFLYDQLGPVIALSETDARRMVADCLRSHHGKHFAIDAQRFDPAWLSWLAANGFTEERILFRMYRGAHLYPGLPQRQFAILGPEFG
ncbi:MAG TPA: GNAT family N-acetyltransferase [Bryobacteraceae bacterium]|jgi:GNAT superfamily N-acetyltransferase|nr:GNAT family N-acetyltransferase [Bryobacteraceae bacterium]